MLPQIRLDKLLARQWQVWCQTENNVLSSLWYISVGLCPAGSSNSSIGVFAVHAKWWMKKWTAPGFPGKVWTYKLLYDSLYVSIQGCSSYGVVCSPSCGKLSFYLILVWQNQTISHYKTQAVHKFRILLPQLPKCWYSGANSRV